MNTIGIDLGSNTLRVVKIDCNNLEKIAEYEKIVRTAQDIVDKKIISKDTIKRVKDALAEAKMVVNFDNSLVRAVATEALRVAKNSLEVLEEIKQEFGVEFEIIDAKEEAILTLLAVKMRLKKFGINKDFILVDIGGGSTEITLNIKDKVYTKSFSLGIVTVANSANSIEEIKILIKSYNQDIKEFLKDFDLENLIFVSTAGTPTTIAALKHNLNYKTYNANIVNGTKLTINDLDIYLNKLLEMSKEQRELAVGVGRDDLIIAGILIFKNLYKLLNKKESIVIDDGLREGVAISLCEKDSK